MNNALLKNERMYAASFLALALVLGGATVALRASAQTSGGNLSGSVATSSSATSTVATSTSATSTIDVAGIRTRIADLEARIASLQSDLASVKADLALIEGNSGVSNGTSTTATSSSSIRVSPDGAVVRAGTSIDLSGRGFWNDEPVSITDASGAVVGRARADGGGNWSTGSMSVPRTTGTKSYAVKGDWSGMTRTVVFTVTP